MDEQRQGIRIASEERSIVNLKGLHFLTSVANISPSGALVHFFFGMQQFKVGDNCIINLDGIFPREHYCKVVRVENSKIALKFIDI